jgi:Spy/CpxP family protein refolding chaperone
MKGTVLALAVAAVTLAAASVQAAPVAPLPPGVNQNNVIQAQYYWHGRHWGHCGWRHHHRRCW